MAGWEYVWPTEGVAATLSMSPHLLTPPAGWEDYSECEDELGGDEEKCSVWVTPRTQTEFWDLPAGDTEDALEIIGATVEETGLLRKAWAVLVDSTDLVRWSACWYTGRSGAGDCMIRHIEGRSVNRTVIEVVDGADERGTAVRFSAERDDGIVAWLTGKSGRITGYRGSDFWSNWLDVWMRASYVDRYCLAVHVAAVLLHELSHVCGASSHLDGRHCEEAWLTGSNYLYAVYHQYPEIVESLCCSSNWNAHKEGVDLFGFDSGSDAVFGSSCAVMVEDAEDDGDETTSGLADRDDNSPIEDDKGMVIRPEWRTR